MHALLSCACSACQALHNNTVCCRKLLLLLLLSLQCAQWATDMCGVVMMLLQCKVYQ